VGNGKGAHVHRVASHPDCSGTYLSTWAAGSFILAASEQDWRRQAVIDSRRFQGRLAGEIVIANERLCFGELRKT